MQKYIYKSTQNSSVYLSAILFLAATALLINWQNSHTMELNKLEPMSAAKERKTKYQNINDSAFNEVERVLASDGAADDFFGNAVAIDGDTVVVGAVGEERNRIDQGAIYVFVRNEGGANNWGLIKKITAADQSRQILSYFLIEKYLIFTQNQKGRKKQ